MPAPRIVVALDFAEADSALGLADRLDPARCALKVGKELFTRAGPSMVRELVSRAYPVFLDLKFHDIPNTVAGACRAAADLGVWMLNVHASGGRRMLEAARTAVDEQGDGPLLVAVTVLTSLAEADLQELGVSGTPEQAVLRLASLAHECGLDGVVCSPREVASLRAHLPQRFKLVTPGIRPADAGLGDQRRTLTPAEAVRLGADYLVIGRPITQAPEPLEALERIEAEITTQAS